MRKWCVLAAALGCLAGCGDPVAKIDGPKVDAFTGSLVADGKPVSFGADETVSLKVFHEKGSSFGIPIKADGSFQIGWMPVGKYSATLMRDKPAADGKRGSAPNQYSVPGGFAIADGQTQYTIELGKGFKP
jgi:hypothetical protein